MYAQCRKHRYLDNKVEAARKEHLVLSSQVQLIIFHSQTRRSDSCRQSMQKKDHFFKNRQFNYKQLHLTQNTKEA